MGSGNGRRSEACLWCECCERPLFLGDYVLRDNRFSGIQVCICFQCFCDMGKRDLAELLGASFEQVDEFF